ncbi:type III-A CRISPR-associated RAMP protein Csm5 [Thermotoga sp. KOL6]|uniref:type III-A CRISPR-associated RAMP protein Csm5 n=1 Tax=Thermotoga sp. KOL6 TaxID=126741 RepID=UPI000C762A80|nr:type III-A CRISPR-associated RAMP protein Csm5 [Thermotoga sp. KOL6]PLV58076.1 type III-A CRISPR-associated RAMP protein Csm5 [Thermotoga sp. KOL6]
MKIVLKNVTPLHIGTGDKYPLCQLLVLSERNGKRKIAVRLKTQTLSKVFSKHPDLFEKIFQPLNLTKKEIAEIQDGFLYEVSIYSKKRTGRILEIIHHPDGSVYIPGSSLKGAIRLALTWYVLKNHPEYLEKFKKIVEDDIAENRKKKKKSERKKFIKTREFLNSIFRINNDMHSDYFRFLRISDSSRVYTRVVVHDVGVFYVERTNKNPLLFPAEFVPLNRTFEFDVKFAKEEYENFAGRYRVNLPDNVEDILKIVNDFYTEVFNFERERFRKAKENFKGIDISKIEERFGEIEEHKEKNILVHIGYGGGLMANSLFILLDEETRKRVRNLIKEHGDSEAPLTRRYLVQKVENNEYKLISPIGWCVLCLEDSPST